MAGDNVGAIWEKVNLRNLVDGGILYPHSDDYLVAPGQREKVYQLLAESLRE